MWDILKPGCAAPNDLQVEDGEAGFKPKRTFSECPHFTWDNCFSGDARVHWAAKEGFVLTVTCGRDRFPRGMPSKCMCKLDTNSTARPKAARLENPILPTKKVEGTGSVLQFATFQSTSSCDFTHVNAVNQCNLFAGVRECGRGKHKQQWGIKMNEPRQLHLNACGKVDTIDHMTKNCALFYLQVSYFQSHFQSHFNIQTTHPLTTSIQHLSNAAPGSTGTLL